MTELEKLEAGLPLRTSSRSTLKMRFAFMSMLSGAFRAWASECL